MVKKRLLKIGVAILIGLSLVVLSNAGGLIVNWFRPLNFSSPASSLAPTRLFLVGALLALGIVLKAILEPPVLAAAPVPDTTRWIRSLLGRSSAMRKAVLVLVAIVGAMLVATVGYFAAWFAWWLIHFVSAARALDFLEHTNFTLSLILVVSSMLCLWIPSVFRRQSWKKLGDPLLKWTGISGVSVGGFGIVGLSDLEKSKLLALAVSKSQVPIATLQGLYAITVLLAVFAGLAWTVGTAAAKDETSRVPAVGFAIAFALGWSSAVGMFTLCLDGTLLTLLGHLSGTQ